MRRLLLLLALATGAGACTERLTTPGTCPGLCPGGEVAVRDTVISAIFGSDSSFDGFTGILESTSILLSTGPALGESRGLLRFLPRGDSTIIGDSVVALPAVDSVIIQLFLQRRDTTVSGLALELYRLPRDVDTMTTVAELDGLMTPERLLRSVSIVDSAKSGPFNIVFAGSSLAGLAFAPEDSTELVIGLKLAAPGSAAARFGTGRSGGQGPVFLTWVTIENADTALRNQLVSRVPVRNFTVRPPSPPLSAGELRLGGFPAMRTFLRFSLPENLRDSVTILRATLELDGIAPINGLPGDSIRVDVRGLLADFGAKSPPVGNVSSSGFMRVGDATLSVDIASTALLWQGNNPLPAALRLQIGEEWSSFLEPRFHSTRGIGFAPRLRITYRPQFPFRGF
ncbi:MAG: hypothetical protein U0974_08355 [Gemmatimonadales bacterium]|nr:hypothetical protein [Gemmatimonadales bacterium]MDZ4389727.1 hypothetical protein [Gemmatimonadales bacterium]